MNSIQIFIHQKTISSAQRYHETEVELLKDLELVEKEKIHLLLGHPSLFQYCLRELNLTESQTSALICVMRKSKVVPALKLAIENGELNVSRSKRIVSVINQDNASEWIEKAKELPQRALEIELAKENPKAIVKEMLKPVSEQRIELRFSIDVATEEKLNRAREVLRTNSLEETLEKLLEQCLKKSDPLLKNLRSLRNVGRPLQRAIPRAIRNRVLIRDKGACTHNDENGQRCGQRQWVEVHHVAPFAMGGDHSLDNLTTLCHGHHKARHLTGRGARLLTHLPAPRGDALDSRGPF